MIRILTCAAKTVAIFRGIRGTKEGVAPQADKGEWHTTSVDTGASLLSLRLSAAAWSVLQSGALHNKSRGGRHE